MLAFEHDRMPYIASRDDMMEATRKVEPSLTRHLEKLEFYNMQS